MFSTLCQRLRVSPTAVIAMVALVFAMSGGAYAAKKYLITSTKQISPSVLKALRGKAGATGPVGPAGLAGVAGVAGPSGPAGAKGETGPAGAAGPAGTPGTNGTNGTSVTNTALPEGNAHCAAGGAEFKVGAGTPTFACNGQSGSSATTLPPEKTETGVWSFNSNGAVEQFVAINFPIPLAKADAEAIQVESLSKAASPTGNCPGSAEEPTAEPGFLCVYTSPSTFDTDFPGNPTFVFKVGSEEPGEVDTTGALLYFESPAGDRSSGSFAITAPSAA